MTLLEAVDARHSVRRYVDKTLAQDAVEVLRAKIEECNREGGLHIQLVLDEHKGFSGLFAYGAFSGVSNYIVMAGVKAADLLRRADSAVGTAARTGHLLGRTVVPKGEGRFCAGARREGGLHDSPGLSRRPGAQAEAQGCGRCEQRKRNHTGMV